MHHYADVAARREEGGDSRAVDEVQVCRTGVLVEAERYLELAGHHLRKPVLLVIQIDVAPGISVGRELSLDLVVEDVEDLALDADAPASDIGIEVVVVVDIGVVVQGQGRVRVPDLALKSHAEIDASSLAEVKRRATVPAEAPIALGLLV